MNVVSVQVEKKAGYGYLKEIVVRQAEYNVYKFKKGDFPDLHLNDIEDMLLLFAQNKLFNLYNDVIMYFIIALKMFTIGIDLKNKVEDVQLGVESYQQKLNLTKPQRTCQHILVKELYTLNYDPPRIIYEDKRKKKWLMIGYNKGIPLREWTEKDKRCTCIMRNKIDDLLLKRRILRSLEVLVGGRKTKMDNDCCKG
ncbi:hypothetical protein Tco_0120841 [Tanacetum coccineum]